MSMTTRCARLEFHLREDIVFVPVVAETFGGSSPDVHNIGTAATMLPGNAGFVGHIFLICFIKYNKNHF